MKEKPILFNTEMVRAILDGRKTVTRRVVKDPYYIDDEQASRVSGLAIHKGTNITHGMPYEDQIFSPGDTLWVRETWAPLYADDKSTEAVGYLYKTDPDCQTMEDYDRKYPAGKDWTWEGRWRPSIHMPREAARIWLRVTDVRVERLQDITEASAYAEGAEAKAIAREIWSYRGEFSQLWESTIKHADRDRYGWAANPFCWVITFERISKDEAMQ